MSSLVHQSYDKFVHQSYDKFSSKTTTVTSCAGDGNCQVRLRHISSSEGEHILLDLEYRQDAPQPMLHQGNLFIVLSGKKRYTLTPHINQPARYTENEYSNWSGINTIITWYESMYYELTKEMLLDMASATRIEMKVTGASASYVVKEKFTGEEKEHISFLIMAKALYNAIFDKSAFNEDIEVLIQRIKEKKRKVARKVARKEQEKKQKTERREQKKKQQDERREQQSEYKNKIDTLEDWQGGIWSGGIFITLIVGGIWSIWVGSWAPIIWFAVITIALGVLVAVRIGIYKSKIKELDKIESKN